MHRLPNKYSVSRFRFAAFFLLAKWVLILGSVPLLCYSFFQGNRDLTHLSMGLLGLAVPITFCQWIIASRARCPLCIGHPLAHRSCSTHRQARRVFGSYRLRVAMSVIFKGYFRCPYCGEPTSIEVRERGR